MCADICTITDLGLFKTRLKTHFFRLAFNSGWGGPVFQVFKVLRCTFYSVPFYTCSYCYGVATQLSFIIYYLVPFCFVVKHDGNLLRFVKCDINAFNWVTFLFLSISLSSWVRMTSRNLNVFVKAYRFIRKGWASDLRMWVSQKLKPESVEWFNHTMWILSWPRRD